jgi:hypothetical protein
VILEHPSDEFIEGTIKELKEYFAPCLRRHNFHEFIHMLRRLGIAQRIGFRKTTKAGRPAPIWRIHAWFTVRLSTQSETRELPTLSIRNVPTHLQSQSPKIRDTGMLRHSLPTKK